MNATSYYFFTEKPWKKLFDMLINNCIKIWDKKLCPLKINNEDEIFSIEFKNIIGKNNYLNINMLDEIDIRVAIIELILENMAIKKMYKSIVERVWRDSIAYRCQKTDYDNRIWFRGNNNRYIIPIYNSVICIGEINGKNEWGINKVVYNSFTKFVEALLNISKLNALATIAYIFDVDINAIFETRKNKIIMRDTDIITKELPNEIELTNNKYDNVLKLSYSYPIKNKQGYTIGIFAVYRTEMRTIIIQSLYNKDKLVLSHEPAEPIWLNETKFDNYPNAPVILFQDIRSAIAIQEKLDEMNYDNESFIITSHLGLNIDHYDWSIFIGHPLYIMPAPSKKYIELINKYIKKSTDFGLEIRIIQQIFLHSQPEVLNWKEIKLNDPEENTLLQSLVVIPDEKNIHDKIHCSMKNSISPEIFKKWYHAIGIDNSNKDNASQEFQKSNVILPAPGPQICPGRVATLEEVTTFHACAPGSYTLVLGTKGSGKTQLCLGLADQLLNSENALPFFPNDGSFEENILIVDGETPLDEIEANLKQHSLDKFINKRLFYLSRFDDSLEDWASNFSLRNDDFKAGIKEIIIKKRCRLVILDSLQLLTGHDPNCCKTNVLKFIKELQLMGASVLLTHHKYEGCKDKMRGNEDYKNEARVVINIRSKKDFDKNKVNVDENMIFPTKGLIVGINYEHHKKAPLLEGSTIWMHLPLATRDWQYIGCENIEDIPASWRKHADLGNQHIQIDGTDKGNLSFPHQHNKTVIQALKNLSPDQRNVYRAIENSGGSATRENLQNTCQFSKDKTLNLLKELEEVGLIQAKGKGKGTFYSVIVE